MSNIRLQGNVSGSGTLTIASPNTNSDFTLNLPASGGTIPVLSSVTNNGVVFINSSGQATSGSALTFDGTNLGFGGTGQRITGDFSNATFANRVMFQTSTVNGNTAVSSLPNGTGTISQFQAYSSSDPANASRLTLVADAGNARCGFLADSIGTGPFLPMTFHTGGSERMRIDTSGNVGIGGTPFSKLDVHGTFTARGNTELYAASINQIWSGNVYGAFNQNNGTVQLALACNTNTAELRGITNHPLAIYTNNTERMRIDSAGNVGIGTSSSGNKLQVAGRISLSYQNATNADAGLDLVDSGNNGGNSIRWLDSGGYVANISQYSSSHATLAGVMTTNNGGGYRFSVNGSELMRINPSGNVGIGTNSPLNLLTVQTAATGTTAGSNVIARFQSNAAGRDATLQLSDNVANSATISMVGGAVAVAQNGVERTRIDTSGNFQFNSGYGSVATAFGCRAWVNFNGTGTVAIRASGNVSSITDNGTGDYTVNFTTAMPDANYAFTVGFNNDNNAYPRVFGTYSNTPTASNIRLRMAYTLSFGTQVFEDLDRFCVAIHR